MGELKLCPFCGMNYAENAWDECGSEYWVCEFCGAASGTARDEYGWQTRPIEDALNKRIAELEEQAWNLNLENERMEEAYWIDETITHDGTLKPSVRKLLERLEKAETDLRLSDDLVKALDNRIAELEEAQRWIPVSERLPECEKDVLVFWGKASDGSWIDWFRTAWRNKYDDGKWCSDPLVPTHWMPMPESPNDTQTQTFVYGKEREE